MSIPVPIFEWWGMSPFSFYGGAAIANYEYFIEQIYEHAVFVNFHAFPTHFSFGQKLTDHWMNIVIG